MKIKGRKQQVPAWILGRSWRALSIADVAAPEEARQRLSHKGSFQGYTSQWVRMGEPSRCCPPHSHF